VRGSTIVLKCEDGAVEFCLQSPEQGIWRKLTIAGAPERAEWVRDGLPLLPPWTSVSWEGGTLPPEPPPPWKASYWHYDFVRDLYSAYANLPADVLRRLHQGTDVSLPLAKLPGPVRDAIASGFDRETAMHNRVAGWPEETLRTPEMRRRHFGIATVTFTYRRAHPDYHYGEPRMHSVPRPHRTVFLQLHFSPWAVKEKLKYWMEFGAGGVGYAKSSPIYRVAMPAAVQHRLCAYSKERHEWLVKWHDERDGSYIPKPGAPPTPEPWP